jgi:outer membrane protein assembly factor BamE (lipoprotein component of BamABCDE complex)
MNPTVWNAALACLLLAGCQSAGDQASALRQAGDAQANLTLGKVQQAVRVGMSGAAVTEALGAPNMVTTDEQRHEVWVYDRVSTEHAGSRSGAGIGLFVAGAYESAGASSSTQRTLTLVVKFDGAGLVRDYSYRSSAF